MNDIEIWKSVVGFEDGYMVSSFGTVKSIDRYITNSLGRKKKYWGCILSPVTNEDGYLKVSLSIIGNDGKRKQKLYSVHRLVCTAFDPNVDNLPSINHINGIKSNNRIENLEWCTCSHNSQHAFDTGLHVSLKGEKHGGSKLTKDQILEIRNIGKSMKLYQIAELYNISFQHVSEILKVKRWTHI